MDTNKENVVVNTNGQLELTKEMDALLQRRLVEPVAPDPEAYKTIMAIVHMAIDDAATKGKLLGEQQSRELARVKVSSSTMKYLELARIVNYFNYHSTFLQLDTTDSNGGRFLIVSIKDWDAVKEVISGNVS